MRTIALVAVLWSSFAFAQGARLAMHPLELREMTAAQREIVQAQYDVMLARIREVHLVGSTSIEDALTRPAGQGCETRDECLRFFAEATESLYAVYARIRPDPLGSQLLVSARVIRSDGTVMRKAALSEPLETGVEITETARKLLARLIDELALDKLEPTLTLQPVAVQGERPNFDQPVLTASAPLRRPAGFALLGVGAVTLAAGAVVAGLAVNGRSKLTPDANGSVPRAQAERALEVAREAQVASVLIPVGVLIAIAGGALAWWPTDTQVVVIAGAQHAGLHVGGRFP